LSEPKSINQSIQDF